MQLAQHVTMLCDLHHANFMFGILERMFDLVNTQFFEQNALECPGISVAVNVARRAIFLRYNKKLPTSVESLLNDVIWLCIPFSASLQCYRFFWMLYLDFHVPKLE